MKSWLNRNLAGFCAASFFSDWCHEMSTAILPIFVSQVIGPMYTPLALGFIQGSSDAASTGAKLVSGFLADRVSFYKPFLIFGYGVFAIFLALIGTAHSIITITLYKTIAWFSKGLREPMRDTWLSNTISKYSYGRAFGLQRSCDTLGALIGPLTTFLLLRMHCSLPSIFFISVIPGICSALSIALLTQEEKPQHMDTTQKNTFFFTIQQLPTEFNYFLWIMFLFGCANFNSVLLIYRVQEVLGYEHSLLVATTHGVLLYAFFNSIRAFSEFGMGTLSDYGNRKVLLAIFGFGFFCIATLGFLSHSTSLLFWLLCFGCAGFSAGTIKVLEKAYASYILPPHVRGTGLGVLQSIDGISHLISSVIVGVLWSFVSPSVGLLYAAAVSFTAMILLLVKK